MTLQQKAWVVFSAQADLPWLKILKPGFRHCALVMNDGKRWMTIDPLSNRTEVTVHDCDTDFDLTGWLKGQGHIVIPALLQKPQSPAPFGIFSCVESVKRMLGIHARHVLTPWQLYKYLEKQNNKALFSVSSNKGDLIWEA